MLGMQEPEIFEQPVGANKDPEAALHEEQAYAAPQPAVTDESSSEDFHLFVYPEERKLGTWSTAFLIINRVIGTGIFSTPSSIIRYTDSVGATLLFWVLGGFMTFCGLSVYLEYGTALPRSGGEKVYLERVYQKPRYLATCVFAVQFVLFAVSTPGCISFSSYILKAITTQSHSDTWLNRGISVAAISAVCLIHSFTPRLGIWLSNGLGALKMILLLLLVCTGFAALGGRTVQPRPDNFSTFDGSGSSAPDDTTTVAAAGYALALLQVLYSYSGWENANYVLTEVRDAPRTLRKAATMAVAAITLLYLLANISYFAAMSKAEMASQQVTVAAQFFENVWGRSKFVTRVVPVLISLSALGNVFAQSFAMPRAKQELAKEGVLPWSKLWASDWPQRAPSGAMLLHWGFTVIFILGSQTKDLYTFATNVFIYSGNWIKVFLGIGLLYLTWSPTDRWKEQRTKFRSMPIFTMFWIGSLLYATGAPFIPNALQPSVPFYVVPVLGTSLLVLGFLYWFIWAKLLPMCGFRIQHEIEQLPDGSERVKYTRVKPKKKKRRRR